MATRKDRPLGVEFAAKFGPPPTKKRKKKKPKFHKKFDTKKFGGGEGTVTIHFGRRSVVSLFFL
jgi:hypothetical protein